MAENEIVVSFDGVKVKDFRAYWTAVKRGDWAGQDRFFALVVRQWQYPLNPNQPESYGELDLMQYLQVQKAISNLSNKLGMSMKNML